MGCLFWLLISVGLSVALTMLVNLIGLPFSSPARGVPRADIRAGRAVAQP
jgi:hypothetical protein